MQKNTVHTLALIAALTGLVGGTSARVNAQTIQKSDVSNASSSISAGVLVDQSPNLPKHSCKGKNDCKGQGGGKHPGKNSCKGKGDCATDGSKPNFV